MDESADNTNPKRKASGVHVSSTVSVVVNKASLISPDCRPCSLFCVAGVNKEKPKKQPPAPVTDGTWIQEALDKLVKRLAHKFGGRPEYFIVEEKGGSFMIRCKPCDSCTRHANRRTADPA